MPMLYKGSRGGVYYLNGLKKVYVKTSKFGGGMLSKSGKVGIDNKEYLCECIRGINYNEGILIKMKNKDYIAIRNFTNVNLGDQSTNFEWISIYHMNKKGGVIMFGLDDFIGKIGNDGITIEQISPLDNELYQHILKIAEKERTRVTLNKLQRFSDY